MPAAPSTSASTDAATETRPYVLRTRARSPRLYRYLSRFLD
jgi:hypothetical protein